MEHSLDTLCGNIPRTIHDTVQHHFEHSKVTMASSCIHVQNHFKPGGTMSMIQGDMVGCIIDTGGDEYGQWVYSKLAAKNEQLITVVTVYQPCKAFLHKYTGQGETLIVGGDLNEISRRERAKAHLFQDRKS
eukprot:14114199-Ditylum_brightwellii.AAC.1